VSPLTSLTYAFRIPLLLICTHRGAPGVKDEPLPELMGRITDRILDTYVSNVEHHNSNKFLFMCEFNKLPAPTYSLPLAGGRARVGVERRIVLIDSTPILTFPLPGGRDRRAYNFNYLWLDIMERLQQR